MKLKVGQPVDIQFSKRYAIHNRGHSIRDVYDALVELITNADDSYNRLYNSNKNKEDGGQIVIEYQEKRKGNPSILLVKDRAEGMDSADMLERLLRVGEYVSEEGNRGYMGRGARDCSALGEVVFESIKDERYYRCKITHDLKLVLENDRGRVTPDLRQRMGITRGNGTAVTLSLLGSSVSLPRFDNLAAELPCHFALRDIMAEDSPSRVKLRRIDTADATRLIYRPPEGDLVLDEELKIPGYPAAYTRLKVWKSQKSLEEGGRSASDRFQRTGILVKGVRAIHECSWPTTQLKNDPYAKSLFGRLECPYIDELLKDYEDKFSSGQTLSKSNPRLVIDPSRRGGLERSHPFVKALLNEAGKKLQALVTEYRDADRKRKRKIANAKTQERLSQLARRAGQFLRDQLEHFEESGYSDKSVDDALSKQGCFLYPPVGLVHVGAKRSFTLYVRTDIVEEHGRQAEIKSDSPGALAINKGTVQLHAHPSKEDRYLASFQVSGLSLKDIVLLSATAANSQTAEALVEVCEIPKPEDHEFASPLEFELPKCKVREGRKKRIKLFAKCPQVVDRPIPIRVLSQDAKKVEIHGQTILEPVDGTNYAVGDVQIGGRVLKSKTKIFAEVEGYKAELEVAVVKNREDDKGIPLEFDIRDSDFGGARAIWNVPENRSNQLLISARHRSIARYLGAADKGYPGQDTPLFRVLLAELITENVIRKLLPLEAEENPGHFEWTELQTPNVIADDVLTEFQRRARVFVSDAHDIMVSEADIRKSLEMIGGDEELHREAG